MPQMAPLQWISLFLYFSILFILTSILGYYMFCYLPTYQLMSKKTKIINWKW
uniref:ATP synthase complex subunit 8 n=1 Tax=Trypodendron signatum TaxID=879022 RepID=A0A343A6K0_9CUCU|nr:ATP synthase F0 subunit 8 [Trypodendron signatum]AOY40205.1 ATP synthase F0 subunit 8 [Trypodendron signatum]